MPIQKYTIHVTQVHIDEAIRRQNNGNHDVCGNCPIAIAVHEQIRPGLRVTLDDIYDKKTHDSFRLPLIAKQIASTETEDWYKLQPVSFEVELSE